MTTLLETQDHRAVAGASQPYGRPGDFELSARTEAGARLVALAEAKAEEFGHQAALHDRDASYPFEAIETLLDAGYFGAPVPEHLGGLGVASVHDLAVAAARLARGDASVAIGVSMHMSVAGNLARKWRQALAAGNQKRLAHLSESLADIVRERQVIATAGSEANQDLTRPAATAIRTETGWLVSGKKIFCTMSPAATLFYVSVSFAGPDGGLLYGYARVPRGAAGLILHSDWDALGMRASGSHSLTLADVALPWAALPGGFPAGRLTSGYIEGNLTAGLFHAASSLGIAEAAHALAVRPAAKPRPPSARDRMLAAESRMEIAAMRALLGRTGGLIDASWSAHPAAEPEFGELLALFAEVQAAKTFINEAAVRVVDRALAMSGGAGYLSKHALSRAYRDVRAGAFMHPLGANRAYELLGEVELGLTPNLH
jgi:alkylation response protein AidB-like acyl-CoA dehydrogenase